MCASVTLPRTTLYTQLVYIAIIGSMITTTQNITASVLWLGGASHAVRLCDGIREDGSTKGNMAQPAVSRMPATLMPLAIKAATVRRAALSNTTSAAPRTAGMGKTSGSG